MQLSEQPPDLKKLAMNVLAWVMCAKRPLTIPELQHALAVKPDDDGLDENDIVNAELIIAVCAGLVTIQHGYVKFVRNTAKEYFKDTQWEWSPNAAFDMAEVCATYLSFNVFKTGYCQTDAAYETRLQAYPFYHYAANYWGHHVRKALGLPRAVLHFLQSSEHVEAASQALMVAEWQKEYFAYSQQPPRQMTGLHLAAYFGLRQAAEALLHEGAEIDAPNSPGLPSLSYGRTPLSLAAEQGYAAVVKLLLEKGAVVDSRSNYGRTPLSYAAEMGNEGIVSLLLEKGANVNSSNGDGQMPLLYAAGDGKKATVKLLLENGARVNAKDILGRTPLLLAAEAGHEAVVKLLLENGARMISGNRYGHTPLSLALEGGHKAVVKLLLNGC